MSRTPCDVCKRFHRGPRCRPTEQITAHLCVTLPSRLMTRLRQLVPWGERSAWVTRVIEAELDRLEVGS